MISICVSVIRGVATRSKKSINESIVFMRQYGFGYAPQNALVFGQLKAIKQRSGVCRSPVRFQRVAVN